MSVSIDNTDLMSSDLRSPAWRVFLAGLASFGIPLGVYLLTLAPTVTLEDSGSFIAAAYHLGVAHPPGYPLWCLLAHAFTWLPAGSIAQRVHLCSAVFAAATTLMTYLTALRLTRDWDAALVAALALGFSRLLWSQAIIAEVYTLNAFLTITAVYCVIRWREHPHPRWLYALALTLGLGLTNHLLLGLIAPALAGWLLIPFRRPLFNTRVLGVCLVCFLSGLSVFAYLPIRARAHPPVNWDNPTTLAKTWRHITRAAYYTEVERIRYSGTLRDAWRHSVTALQGVPEAFTWPFTALALAGAVWLWRGRRSVVVASLAILLLNIAVLNPLLKAPATPRTLFIHRVFYLPAHILMALWISGGCAWLLAQARRHSRADVPVVAVALILCLGWTLAMNFPHNNRSHYELARNLGLDFLNSAPPQAGLLLVTDEVLFVCSYLKWVEGLRPDVQILDPFFGYQNTSVSAVISDRPATPELIKYHPTLRGVTSVPFGLGYQLIKADTVPSASLTAFAPLSHPPRDPAPVTQVDPLEMDVYARYACYHARLGAQWMREQHPADAQREFAVSERLRKEDPYACFLLASLYHQFGLYPERVKPMMKEAIRLLDRHYDPADYRFYPVTRQEIEQALSRLEMTPKK